MKMYNHSLYIGYWCFYFNLFNGFKEDSNTPASHLNKKYLHLYIPYYNTLLYSNN